MSSAGIGPSPATTSEREAASAQFVHSGPLGGEVGRAHGISDGSRSRRRSNRRRHRRPARRRAGAPPAVRAENVESSFSTSPEVHCGHATSVP